MKMLKHMACGFCMGCADIIPGVSGGTVALILGIYQRLISAIAAFNITFIKLFLTFKWHKAIKHCDLFFIIPLAIGLVGAVLFFTKIVGLPALMVTHSEVIYGLFFGLIFASAIMLLRQRAPLYFREKVVVALGATATLALLQSGAVTLSADPITLFLCGMLASSAMLLPGISGSFILVLIGQYALVLQAVSDADLEVLLPFLGGVIAGIMLMARIIRALLVRFERPTLLLMIGVLFGSLWKIWPFQETVSGSGKTVLTQPALPTLETPYLAESIAAVVAGILIIYMLDRLQKRHLASKYL